MKEKVISLVLSLALLITMMPQMVLELWMGKGGCNH